MTAKGGYSAGYEENSPLKALKVIFNAFFQSLSQTKSGKLGTKLMDDNSNNALEKLAKLKSTFASRLPDKIIEIENAVGGSLETAQALAHKLAGSAGTHEFSNIGHLARNLELLCESALKRTGKPSDEDLKQINELITGLHEGAKAGSDTLLNQPDLNLRSSQAPIPNQSDKKAKKIILVDDDIEQSAVLEQLLSNFGFDVHVLDQPSLLRDAVKKHPPSAVIMDIIFHGDRDAGLNTINTLREDGFLECPVIFASVREDFQARLQAIRCGADGYVVKPVNIIEMVETLDRLIEASETSPLRVLLVDDDPEITDFSQAILEGSGLVTSAINDPLLAVDEIQKFHPDVIVLDVDMPNCNGIELAAAIRQMGDQFVQVPILFLTSHSDNATKMDAASSGSEDYFTKPFDPVHFVTSVTARAERSRTLKGLFDRVKAGEERFSSITKAANEAVVSADERGLILSWNKSAELIFGYKNREILGKPVTILMPEEFRHAHMEGIKRVKENGERKAIGQTVELRGLRKDGSEFPLELSLSSWKAGGSCFFAATIRDITERRKTERSLQETETQFKAMAEASPNMMAIVRFSDGVVVYSNSSAEAVLGITPEEIIGTKASDYYADSTTREAMVKQLEENDHIRNFETRFRKTDGSAIWISLNSRIADLKGEPHLISEITDISDRRQAEIRLEKSEQRFKDFTDTASDWVWESDADHRVIYAQGSIFDEMGFSKDVFMSKTRHEFAGQNNIKLEPEKWSKHQEDLDHHRPFRDFEYPILNRDEELQYFQISGKPLFEPDGKFLGFRGTGADVTKRVKVEQLVQSSERKNRLLLESAGEGIFGVNLKGQAIFVNPAACKMLGYPEKELVGQPMHALSHHSYADGSPYPQEKCRICATINKRETHQVDDEVFWRKDDSCFPVRYTSTPIVKDGEVRGAVVTFSDITARKAAEDTIKEQREMTQLLYSIISIVNEAANPDVAMQHTLESICKFAGWPLGHVFLRSPDNPDEMLPSDLWYLEEPTTLATFRAATKEMTFKSGKGLPGRVLESGEPTWIEDVALDRNFPRAPQAENIGVRGAFAFPVLVDKEVVAVLEFFTSDSQNNKHPNLQAALPHIGVQLGQAVKRWNTEQELRTSEELTQSILNTAAEGILTIDDHGLIETFNPAAERIFGYTEKEAVGNNVSILMKTDERETHEKYIKHAKMHAPRIINKARDLEGLRKDGTSFTLEINVSPMQIRGQQKYVGILHDITERREAAHKLAESESRFRAFLDHSPVGMALKDADGRFILRNPASEQFFGKSEAESIGKTAHELFAKEFADKTEAHDRRVRDERISLEEEREVPLEDGVHTIRVSKFPVLNTDDELIGTATIEDDITELNKATEALRSSQQMMSNLLKNTREGYWYIDNDVQTVKANPAMCKILGRSESEILGKSIYDFVDEENAEVFRREIRNRKVGGKGFYEIGLSQPDGTIVPCLNSATPVYDEKGNKTGSVGLLTEIGPLKQAREEADKANQAKSDFLSSMSHELRTPLNAILGFGQMLDFNPNEPLSAPQKECVDHIITGGEHLLKLINDILDLSKIEAGKVDISIEDTSPADVLDECLILIETMAKKQGIQISVPDATQEVPVVRADYTRFKQVLLNLISNAVKYNREKGSIKIRFEETTDKMLRIAVCDTGKGIPKEKQKELFKPFSRLGAENTNIEGTGIGLVVCKELVELMGGTIGLESETGKGSTFWIKLPLSDGDHNGVDETEDTEKMFADNILPDVGGTLLYVEDNPANLQLMELIVKRINGLSLISANTGEEGIKLAQRYNPYLIILDINLPGMNGIEVLKTLRSYNKTRNTPVLALSAAATKKDITKGMQAGFLQYLTKPIKIQAVVDAIDEVLKSQDCN